jgi:hypothetical protein
MIIPLTKEELREAEEIHLMRIISICANNNISLEVTELLVDEIHSNYKEIGIA